jgi:L-iditol 2-dehydrogenase
MLTVELKEPGRLEFLDTPIPEPKGDEVLVQMKRLGICGSDVQIYHGKHKYAILPLVQGHEGAGMIAKVGADVTQFAVGQKVTVQQQVYCGECYPCSIGHNNVCEHLQLLGIHLPGLAAEYVAVKASMIVGVPDDMDYDDIAMVEPAAVAVGTIRRCGDVEGYNVAVLGAGPIGNLVAQVAVARGANVLLGDVDPGRLRIAQECGVGRTVNMAEEALGKAISAAFGERGADIIIDCAGAPASLQQAIDCSRPASRIVIVGNFKEPVEIEMPRLQRREVDLVSVMMHVRSDFTDAVDLIASSSIDVSRLVTQHYPIGEFGKAYDYIDSGARDIMKIVLSFES